MKAWAAGMVWTSSPSVTLDTHRFRSKRSAGRARRQFPLVKCRLTVPPSTQRKTPMSPCDSTACSNRAFPKKAAPGFTSASTARSSPWSPAWSVKASRLTVPVSPSSQRNSPPRPPRSKSKFTRPLEKSSQSVRLSSWVKFSSTRWASKAGRKEKAAPTRPTIRHWRN